MATAGWISASTARRRASGSSFARPTALRATPCGGRGHRAAWATRRSSATTTPTAVPMSRSTARRRASGSSCFRRTAARPSGDGAHRRWAIDPCPRNTERSEEDTQSIAFGPTVGAIPATASPEGESGAAVLARGVQPPASPVRQRSVVARLKERLSGQAEPPSENRTVTAPEPPSAHPPFQEATGPLS